MNRIELFIEARDYLIERIEPTIKAYFTGIWDPLITYIIAKEIDSLMTDEVIEKFPELPNRLQPRFKYRVFETEDKDGANIEVNIQKYINTDYDLSYLGAVGIGSVLYDLYHRDAYDGSNDKYFIARYGHDYNSYFAGSKTAEAEYYLGAMTPLSVAYRMAMDDGII